MDPPASTLDQVRTTQACSGEISVLQHLQHLKQSPSKGVKNTQQNASLKLRKDGSLRLIYSTKTDINYVSHEDRQKLNPVPKEYDMFGLTNLQWNALLSANSTIRTAMTYDPVMEMAQKKVKLSQVKRDELMYQLRQLRDPDNHQSIYHGKLYADYITPVQVSDGNGTVYEQTAVCAAIR